MPPGAAAAQQETRMSDPEKNEPKGVVDLASVLYVVGGIPAMILFFVVLFALVGACDGANVYLKF